VLGLRVEEFDPYIEEQTNSVQIDDGTIHACYVWSDVIDLEGAQALAHYTEDFYAGRPAVTRNTFGAGAAYYVGTYLDQAGMEWLLDQVLASSGVAAPLDVPPGVEVVRRAVGHAAFLFVLNHTRVPVVVQPPPASADALTGQPLTGAIELEPFGAAVLRSV
jgi:beta-galactosidase